MDGDYLTLQNAADYLSRNGVACSVDDIIHQGVKGKLEIYILLGGFNLTACDVMCNIKKYGDAKEGEIFPTPKVKRLHRQCLFNIESQKDPDVILHRDAIYSYDYDDFELSSMEYSDQTGRFRQAIGYTHFNIRRHGELTARQIIKLSKTGLVFADTNPVKIAECTMVVLPDGIEQFKQSNATTQQAKDPEKNTTERELTTWLRETWIKEGMPGGTAFFNRLKQYVNQKDSPIAEHWTTGKDGAGFRWNTGAATDERTKKTIQNMVSEFKKEHQQNTVKDK